MSFNTAARWLDEHVEDMVELQRMLTAVPAIGPENNGKGEWEKSNLLESWLAERGLSPAEHYDTPDGRVPEGSRPNFVVRLPGRRKTPRVWVMSHTDVVPPGERLPDGSYVGWTGDPYVMRREGDFIYGRGVEDNQQAIVSSVFAVLALKENGLKPEGEVALLMVAAEETGSEYGLQYVLRKHRRLFGRRDIIIVPDGGNAEGSMIEVAEKSVLWLQFKVKGKQSHGSMPHRGCNAFRAVLRLADALDRGLRERFDVHDDLYDPPYSTFEPTMHDKNVPNINTIPGEDMFCLDCRVMPRFKLDDVLAYVRSEAKRVDAEVGTATEIVIRNRLDAPAPTAHDAPVVKMLQKALKEVCGVEGKPMGVGGSTVAAFFRMAGYPAVVWGTTRGTAHQVNECCAVSDMVRDAKVFAHVFMQKAE
jgi:succinyl-diaminopimelate desuccinylase